MVKNFQNKILGTIDYYFRKYCFLYDCSFDTKIDNDLSFQ